MLASLSPRERRTVIGGGVLLGVAVVCLRIGPLWWQWTGTSRAEAAVAVAELADARASVVALSSSRDSLAARNARYLALAPAILAGRTPGAVGAALASAVFGAAAGAGMEVGAITIRPDTSRASFFTRPSVRGDARGDIAGLTRFLVALERGPLILVLRQLSVSQPDAGAPADHAESLRVEFVVEAIALEQETVEALRVSERTPDRGQPSRGNRVP